MENEKDIVVNMAEGQNTLTILKGDAPKMLDELPPIKVNLTGTIEAPLAFLKQRVGEIDQKKAHIIVNRDKLQILLVINEDDARKEGRVLGTIQLSEIFMKLGINQDKQWQPEALGQFLKLNRSFFVNKEEGMNVVSQLKSFNAKVHNELQRDKQENGNRQFNFRQQVDSNIPDKFKLKMPVFSGGEYCEIEVETFASIDGTDVTIGLQSAGANELTEKMKMDAIGAVVKQIEEVTPGIVIIEQ